MREKPFRLLRHPGRLALLFVGVLLPLLLLGKLAEDVAEKEVFGFDGPIQMFVHRHSSAALDMLMFAATEAGSVLALAPLDLIVLIWLWRRAARSQAWFWLVAVAGAAVINFLAKLGFARVRPSLWISRIHETTYSFPSGHAMSSMATVAAVCVLLWPTRWRWPVLAGGAVYVVLVGLSRVYFGVHYPSDVLAGWAASLAWVLGLAFIFGMLEGWAPKADAPAFTR